jgi:CubicO group peptidase (beta-lactamase class C family)
MIWAHGDMFKAGYSGQGIYIAPARDIVIVWFGAADIEFGLHNLLPLARKMFRYELLN